VIKIDLKIDFKKLLMKAAINSIFEQVVYNLTEYADFAKIPGFNLKKSWQTL
jgi:hypothetical protein